MPSVITIRGWEFTWEGTTDPSQIYGGHWVHNIYSSINTVNESNPETPDIAWRINIYHDGGDNLSFTYRLDGTFVRAQCDHGDPIDCGFRPYSWTPLNPTTYFESHDPRFGAPSPWPQSYTLEGREFAWTAFPYDPAYALGGAYFYGPEDAVDFISVLPGSALDLESGFVVRIHFAGKNSHDIFFSEDLNGVYDYLTLEQTTNAQYGEFWKFHLDQGPVFFQPFGDGVGTMDDPASEDNMTGAKGFKLNKGFKHKNGFTEANGFTKKNGF